MTVEPETAKPLTLSVPEAGKKYLDLTRDQSYDAARRGVIPVIKISARCWRVPVAAMESFLDQAGRSALEKVLEKVLDQAGSKSKTDAL
jgi:hypothetical protein